MKFILLFSSIIFQLLSLGNPQTSTYTLISLVVLLIIKFFYYRKKSSFLPLTTTFLCYLELSFSIIYPISKIAPGEIDFLGDYKIQDFLLLYSLIFSIFSYGALYRFPIQSRVKKNEFEDFEKQSNESSFIIFLVIGAFFISIVSLFLGLGKMGSVSIELPFKLAGIINVSRIWLLPYLFVITYYLIKNKNKRLYLGLAFVAWSLLESYLRMSRGVIFRNFLPFIIIFIIKEFKLSFRAVALFLSLVFIGGGFFIVTDTMRQLQSLNQEINLKTIYQRTEHRIKIYNSVPYYFFQRVFPNGLEVCKYLRDYKFEFFDANFSRIMKWKGHAMFHTRILDKVRESLANSQHNSGIGGLSDGFFMFGFIGLITFSGIFFGFYLIIDTFFSEQVFTAMAVVFSLDILFGGLGSISYIFYGSFLLRSFFPFLILVHLTWIMKEKILNKVENF